MAERPDTIIEKPVINPGFAGRKIVPTSFDKIKRLRKYLDEEEYEKK